MSNDFVTSLIYYTYTTILIKVKYKNNKWFKKLLQTDDETYDKNETSNSSYL